MQCLTKLEFVMFIHKAGIKDITEKINDILIVVHAHVGDVLWWVQGVEVCRGGLGT